MRPKAPMRLLVTGGLPIADGIIGAGIDLTWPTPTRPRDTLHVELVVTDVRQRTEAKILVFERPKN